MMSDYHRHDVSDEVWNLLEQLLPGRKGAWGGNARDNKKFIKPCYGYCVPEHRGVTCRLTTGIGTTSADASVAGETKVYGKQYLKS